jgi:uncharacterized protein (DUF4415 family)
MSKPKIDLSDDPIDLVDDPENPEWTVEDFRNGRSWEELSDLEKSVFKRPRGRPTIEAPKKLVSLRLDAEVLEALEASGPGWRQRINDILKAALKDDKAA